MFRQPRFLVFQLVATFAFFLLIGVMLFGFGGLILSGQFGDFEKTTAVIEEINPSGEDVQVIVSYTVNGRSYRSDLGYYSDDLMIGNEIQIKYAPEDPENIRSVSADYFGYAILAAGVIVIFIGSRILVKGLKRRREEQEQEASFRERNEGIPLAERMFPANEEGVLYYFHFDKSFSKQGHVMENRDKQVVYEGAIQKAKLIGDYEMAFINHLSGHTETHFIGHTVTTRTGNITTAAGFDYDGVNIWEVLRGRGVQMQIGRHSFTEVSFEATVNGRPFARFVSCGANLYGEEKKGLASIANLSAPGLFRIYAFGEDIDLLFLIGVAIARSRT